MKPTRLPLKFQSKLDRKQLKKILASDKRLNTPEKNTKRLRIVRSATAGDVRGGHSFH